MTPRQCWCGQKIKGAANFKRHEEMHARDHALGVLEDTMAFAEKRERQIDTVLGLDPDAQLRESGMAEYEETP